MGKVRGGVGARDRDEGEGRDAGEGRDEGEG